MDCFHNQSTVNICIAGPNRRAGYATVWYPTSCLLEYHHKDRYSFLNILAKFHMKIIKNKQDTAKYLA